MLEGLAGLRLIPIQRKRCCKQHRLPKREKISRGEAILARTRGTQIVGVNSGTGGKPNDLRCLLQGPTPTGDALKQFGALIVGSSIGNGAPFYSENHTAERHQRLREHGVKCGKRPRIRALWEITMAKKTKPELKRAPKSIARRPTKSTARRITASKSESRLGAIETQLNTIEDRLDKIETDIKEIKPKLDQVYKDMAEVLDIADKIAAMRERMDEMFEFYTNNRASGPPKDAP